MDVSVIIPTYNEGKSIETTLLAVRSQTKSPKEILVVDNFSKDRTVEIARKYAKVIKSKSNIAQARNIGASKASSELLLFLDADTLLLPNVIEKLSKEFNKKRVVIASLPLYPLQMKFKHYVLTKIGWEFIPKTLNKYKRPIFCGACIMVRKSAFDKINGFREDLSAGDDIDFTQRISKVGKSVFCTDTFALTDMRRFEKSSAYWTIYWIAFFFYYKLTGKGFKNYKAIR
ncbi:MAG: glycosyltransferase [Candidatus Aenigmarchaeota archaeon]|nr:glycosyltransferase [Candidatus Aenigmarchaeota archaeon]